MSRSIERILLVDDEATFLTSMRRHLKREGFSLETAGNGRDACDKIADRATDNDPFDLVVTDLLMPDVDGIQLLAWVKKHYPQVSVIILTGFGDGETVSRSLRLGVDGFGAKPITPCGLMALIDRIDRHRARSAGQVRSSGDETGKGESACSS